MPKSSIRYISQVRVARARYPALEDDCDTINCFFDIQQTRDDPTKTQKLVTDRLV